MTDKPSMVTDVTVINRVNIGSDHRMVMGSITLNTRAERRKLLNNNKRTRVDTQMIGTKKNKFQLELKNRFTALEEHDDIFFFSSGFPRHLGSPLWLLIISFQ